MPRKIKLENIKPTVNIFFIVGMSATGKTTTSKKLSKKLKYKLISMDNVIEKIAIKHPDKMKITKLYHPNKYLIEKKQVIKNIKDIIKEYKNVVIEGTIWDPYIIKQIAKKKTYKIIYVQPSSKEQYIKNIKKRVKTDIKTKTKTMAIVWKFLSRKDIDDKNILHDFIKKLVDYRFKHIKDDYNIFKNFTIRILIN